VDLATLNIALCKYYPIASSDPDDDERRKIEDHFMNSNRMNRASDRPANLADFRKDASRNRRGHSLERNVLRSFP